LLGSTNHLLVLERKRLRTLERKTNFVVAEEARIKGEEKKILLSSLSFLFSDIQDVIANEQDQSLQIFLKDERVMTVSIDPSSEEYDEMEKLEKEKGRRDDSSEAETDEDIAYFNLRKDDAEPYPEPEKLVQVVKENILELLKLRAPKLVLRKKTLKGE